MPADHMCGVRKKGGGLVGASSAAPPGGGTILPALQLEARQGQDHHRQPKTGCGRA